MINIKADFESSKVSVTGMASNVDCIMVVHAAIKAYSEIKNISYDSAKIDIMREIVKFESFMDTQDRLVKMMGNEKFEKLAGFVKDLINSGKENELLEGFWNDVANEEEFND